MKRITVAILSFLMVFALISCASTEKVTSTAKITIECPTPGGSLIAPGRHFKVSGTLEGSIPEDAVVKVALLDATGTEIRYASADTKGIDSVDLSWYDGPVIELVPGTTLDEVAYTAPELVVKPGKSPLDATIKAVYTDDTFYALIVTATAVENGLTDYDFFGFTDGEGKPYTAFPEGKYTIVATVSTSDGTLLSSDKKDIVIGRSKGTVVHEVTNGDVIARGGMDLLMGWAGSNGYVVLNDLLPGMYGPFYQLTTIGVSFASETSEYIGNEIKVVLYGNVEISPSNSLEIAQYLQRTHNAENADVATYYVFNYGEPVIQGEVGAVVKMDTPVQVLRIDQVTDEAKTGYYLTSEEQTLLSDINPADGWTVDASKNFALMGAIQPYQLKDEEIIDMEDTYSFCVYLNNVGSFDYVLVDAATKAVVSTGNQPAGIIRNTDDMASAYEFYLVFDEDLVEAGKSYEMTLCAKDRKGAPIENRTLSFSFNAN